MSWSHDGTVVSGAGGSGAVAFGYIVDRQMSWSNIEAVLDEDNKINVNDVLNEMNEDLDYRERVVNMSIQYGFMVVCTISQCYVYNIVT